MIISTITISVALSVFTIVFLIIDCVISNRDISYDCRDKRQ